MSERMSLEASVPAVRRQWWWQRRPPADRSRFARGVWWAGHVQLPIALVLLVVCAPALVIGGGPWGAGSGWASLGLSMSGPFALSGTMLRASSSWRTFWAPPVGGGLVRRIAVLAVTVAGIAVVSIVLTALVVYLMLIFSPPAGTVA
jgi:hypothetical protein